MITENCIFCKIVRNQSLAYPIYEDEDVLAFMDNRPVSEGHTLVITKKHYENIYAVPDEEVEHLFRIVKKVTLAVKTAVKAEGVRIVQSNGSSAGQVIFHIHVHVIPAYEGQNIHFRKTYEAKELERIAAKIRPYI